jgi:hypothetical protein
VLDCFGSVTWRLVWRVEGTWVSRRVPTLGGSYEIQRAAR